MADKNTMVGIAALNANELKVLIPLPPNYRTYAEFQKSVEFAALIRDKLFLSSTSLSLNVGESGTLTASIGFSSVLAKNLKWSNTNSRIATVDANTGKVTAIAEGTTVITAKTDTKEAKCEVTVKAVKVTEVYISTLKSASRTITKIAGVDAERVSGKTTTIKVGATKRLYEVITPANATNKKVTWNSSNSNVADIDATGLITATSEGETTITVTTADGGKKDTCKINVTAVSVSQPTAPAQKKEYPSFMFPANSEQQRLQMELYIKLRSLNDKLSDAYRLNRKKFEEESYSLLKNMVQNKKGYESEQIAIEELMVAKKYFEYFESIIEDIIIDIADLPLPREWHQECRLEEFEEWFNLDIILKLLKIANMQQEIGSSLIPIKGISKIMQAKLRNLAIFDVAGLIAKGRTQEKRNDIAHALDVDVRLVNSWVKQADLWRVTGMTTDTAYFLVQIGVRNAEDLANLDIDKAYPIMERLAWMQPDFYLIDKEESFAELIENAGEFSGHSCVDRAKFSELLAKEIAKFKGDPLTQEDIERLLEKSKDKPAVSINVETWELPPYHLFRKDIFDPIEYKSSGKIITDGLEFLENLPRVLPLPSVITGDVEIKWNDEKTNANNPNFQKRVAYDVLVEISGIASSSTDKTEKEKTPKAYTTSEGKFLLTLPEKFNMQEGIIFTVSQGAWKQTFMKNAAEIISSVPEQEIIDLFASLQSTKYFIETKEWELEERSKLMVDLELVSKTLKEEKELTSKQIADLLFEKLELERKIERIDDNCKDIKKEIKDQETQYGIIKKEILDKHNALFGNTLMTTDLEKIYHNILTREIKANIGTLTLIEEIFKGYRTDLKKALPSVKLMGSDDNPIHLSSDTVPSRVFNFGMLHRLVEPAIGPKVTVRKKLNAPVDVMDFKKQMYTNPDTYPQMVSLGIGYVLNMHQAWAPDGFALGSLLYSLVLAPGEEQRLVVRENTQDYTISDEMEGMDSDQQTYQLSQRDDETASFVHAVDQMSRGNSGYEYDAGTYARASSDASYGTLVIFGGGSSSSSSGSRSWGSGSSYANQSNAHREASNAAQSFQHNIKSAASRISQSKRLDVRTATSEERNSVATKIIANHNHSHAMTIQYWEVMRRYRLETCIDGIDLVLFVPLKIIKFIPDGNYTPNLTNFNRDMFLKRYDILLKYADSLQYALPLKYRTGLNLIKKYAAYPDWKLEPSEAGARTLTLTFDCTLMEFDDITVSLSLKNGKGTIAGDVKPNSSFILAELKANTSTKLKKYIREKRNQTSNLPKVTCKFAIPAGISEADFSQIRITHSCDGFEYMLVPTEDEKINYDALWSSRDALAMDNISSDIDQKWIELRESRLSESYLKPVVRLSSKDLSDLGAPVISNVKLDYGIYSSTSNSSSFVSTPLSAMLSSSTLRPYATLSIVSSQPVLLRSELQKMEETMHHIASETVRYSQVIWSSLSKDELAIMLEQYTIDMNFDGLNDFDEEEEEKELDTKNQKNLSAKELLLSRASLKSKNSIDIPLLNCVNVKKPLGFYGNCILLPFTFPKRLAKKLGKSAAEIQDALYRYHTCYFRVPNTTISLPTNGMVGEAVLGETNVSEKIDLTRFWNWKDSPIDKMEITPDYLNNTDYLAGKTTKDITALNLQGATAATPVTVNDLITALVNKKTPEFANITGLDQLKDVLNAGTQSAADGRKEALENNTKVFESTMDFAKSMAQTAAGAAQSAMGMDILKSGNQMGVDLLKDPSISDERLKIYMENNKPKESAKADDSKKDSGKKDSGKKAEG